MSLESFEAEAELFYKDTGYLAPGKSEPAAGIGQLDFDREEVRRLMKKAWDAGRRRAALSRRDKSAEAGVSEEVREHLEVAKAWESREPERFGCSDHIAALKFFSREYLRLLARPSVPPEWVEAVRDLLGFLRQKWHSDIDGQWDGAHLPMAKAEALLASAPPSEPKGDR